MEAERNSLEIGEVSVYPGSQVNVQWRGAWYEGVVVKIGPYKKLCKVRDAATRKTLLMSVDSRDLRPQRKPSKSFAAFRPSKGTRVMYADGATWREGEIVSTKAVGDALVRWRKSALSSENENWFARAGIAPIIHNEAYLAYHREQMEAGKHGLLPNDMINPKPRTVLNPLMQPSPESQLPVSRTQEPLMKMHGSPTYESIASEDVLSDIDYLPPPPPPVTEGAMRGVRVDPRVSDQEPHSPSYDVVGSPQSGYRQSIEQSSWPCMWSYNSQTGGILPHHSSRFFKLFQTSCADRRSLLHHSALDYYRQSNIRQAHSFSGFSPPHREPSMLSEPTRFKPPQYRQGKPPPVGRRRGEAPVSQRNEARRRYVSNPRHLAPEHHHPQSGQPNHLPTDPQPYEIPRRTRRDRRSPYDKLIPRKRLEVPKPASSASNRGTSHDPVDYAEVQFTQTKGPPPTITTASPSVVMANRGRPMLLTCAAKSPGTAPLKYEWYKDGSKLTDDGHKITFPAPEMLHIDRVTDKEVGRYSCVVSNEYGSETRKFHLGLTAESAEEARLTGKFTSKVTPEELGVQPVGDKDQEVDLDSLLDLDPKLFSMEEKEEEDKGSPEGAPAAPKIIVTDERKTLKHNRQRVSSVLENGVEQYLIGGEDYGTVSSETDLTKEGLELFKPAEVARSLDKLQATKIKRENEERQTEGHQDKQPEAMSPVPAMVTEAVTASERSTDSTSVVKSASKAAMKLLRLPRRPLTPHLRKKTPKGFETSNIVHQGEEQVHMTARIREVLEPGQFKLKQFSEEETQETKLHKPLHSGQNGSPPNHSAGSVSHDEHPSRQERPDIAKLTRAADHSRQSKPHPLTVSLSASSTVPAANGAVVSQEAGKEKVGELPEIDVIMDQVGKLQESLQTED